MNYTISLSSFDGPLDLLLHLIKKSEIDIYDISIEEISNQYLNYINQMEIMNLDIASEYLVMATELINIKAISLLPKKNNDDKEEEEELRENLIERLIEYKNYKEMAELFKKMEDERNKIYSKNPEDINKYNESNEINIDDDITVFMLSEALKNLLIKNEMAKPLDTKITNKEYSVTKRSEEIKKVLKVKKKICFDELFDNFSKSYVVVTFLSILNMAKKSVINLSQDNNFSTIVITLRDDNL